MINGVHAMIFSKQAERTRTFLRDKLASIRRVGGPTTNFISYAPTSKRQSAG